MQTRQLLHRSGIGVDPARPLAEVAAVMERSGIGFVAIIDGDHLVGVATDRDIVRRGLAAGLQPDARIDAVMSSPVLTIEADDDARDALAMFRRHAIRRLAVTDAGRFIGVLSLDDLLVDLATDLVDLTMPLALEVRSPHREATVPATSS